MRNSSTDELPCFKFDYTEQEKKQKAASLQEWMKHARCLAGEGNSGSTLTGIEPSNQSITDPGNIYDTNTKALNIVSNNSRAHSHLCLDIATQPQGEYHQSAGEDDDVASPEVYEVLESLDGEEDCSDSGGSHSHTEMASIIEYPADVATPDVSVSEAQDSSEQTTDACKLQE